MPLETGIARGQDMEEYLTKIDMSLFEEMRLFKKKKSEAKIIHTSCVFQSTAKKFIIVALSCFYA